MRIDGYEVNNGHEKYDFANIDECQYYEEQRPHGEWIEHRTQDDFGFFHSEYECSECHDDIWQKTEWHFCPNCGYPMISSNSEIEKSKSEIVPDYRDGWRLNSDNSAWSPVVMRWFTRCPLCHKRVRLPKKDYWESMKEEDKK